MSDESGEEQAERGESEQADPDAAPLLVGLACDDHGRRPAFRAHRAFGRGPGAHFTGDGGIETVVLFIFFVLGKCRGGHGGGCILVDGLFINGEDFGAGVVVFEIKVAGGFELDGLVIGIAVGQRDVDLEIGVVEDILLAFLDGGRRCRRQGRLGLGRLGGGLW